MTLGVMRPLTLLLTSAPLAGTAVFGVACRLLTGSDDGVGWPNVGEP
ncbi:MAG: hypothetical protein AB1511_04300 [Deinococcota bacterium]